jgi:SET domain-containing protein
MENQMRSGFRFRHEVRDSPGKGLGVFALETIPKGQIVWQFIPGQFEVYDERAFRSLIEPMNRDEAVYVFTHCFGFRDLPECVIRVLDDGALINHAAAGNLATGFDIPMRMKPDISSPAYLQQVGQALCEDRFAMLSSRVIAAGEEFTNNYSEDLSEPSFFNRLYEEYGVLEDYLE